MDVQTAAWSDKKVGMVLIGDGDGQLSWAVDRTKQAIGEIKMELSALRNRLVKRILAKQDEHFRWGFDEKLARERPGLLHYWPKYKSTLWTLLLLADIQAPVDIPQIEPSIQLITEQFYAPEQGIFTLPDDNHGSIPCLNGNMIYLHYYYGTSFSNKLEETINFFDTYQRFDDGDFKTPASYPYFSNTSCYGKHTCYWGVGKLLKGLSFIPEEKRTNRAIHLLENCIEFVLLHEVCFSSHNNGKFLHRDIDKLTFPSIRSDYLELLWLLAREGVQDKRTMRAVELLRSKMKEDGGWELEKPIYNLTASVGQKDRTNAFITERAMEVLEYYG